MKQQRTQYEIAEEIRTHLPEGNERATVVIPADLWDDYRSHTPVEFLFRDVEETRPNLMFGRFILVREDPTQKN